MLDIDGSRHEGGGAILRLSAGLSAITGKPIRIFNIRKNRPVPGLRAQHLEGLKAVSRLSGGTLKGAAIGSTEVEFRPGQITPRKIQVKIETAGSVGLLFQSVKLLGLKAEDDIEVLVTGGGTFGKFAPPLPYTQNILLPVLKKSGYSADISVERHGFYPVGGARTELLIRPSPTIKPIQITNPGKLVRIEGLSIASNQLRKPRVAERQASFCKNLLSEKTGVDPNITVRYVDSACPGSGIVVWATTSSGAILGSDGLGERGKPAEAVGSEAAASLLKTINSKAPVDPYLSDQLIPFMTLSEGPSAVLAPGLTGHARTNIWLIKKFLDVDFKVEGSGNNVLITCDGS